MTSADRAIMAAVASLRPGAAWNFNYGKGLAGLLWLDRRIARPSDAEINAEITRLAAVVAAPAAAASAPVTSATTALPPPSPAAAALDQHLAAAINQLSTTAPKGKAAMRGMSRLANVTEQLMKNLDAEADAAADEVEKAGTEARAAIGKFRAHAGDVRKIAADVMAQLGQYTNMDPNEASAGSSAPAENAATTTSG